MSEKEVGYYYSKLIFWVSRTKEERKILINEGILSIKKKFKDKYKNE